MKARKIAGIRLVNYIEDGITWKSHKDVILDFWIAKKCQEVGYSPFQFRNMFRVVQLPTAAQQKYEEWFNHYDFQNETDKDWLNFVNGTLNLFYHTADPNIETDETWFIDLMQSEIEARNIVTEQVYHGNPNLNAFWKVETNSKPEEVGGRRNGYIYVTKLTELKPADTQGYYWGVIFQCPDSVSLTFDDGGTKRRKCICWAADATHMTLVRIGSDGRLLIVPVFNKGKGWKADRWIPEGRVNQKPMSSVGLLNYINQNYHRLYGIWDQIDAKVKNMREQTTSRLTAVNVMNDEEIKLSKVIGDLDKFVREGNVPNERREYNREVRNNLMKRLRMRDKEVREQVRKTVKAEKRKDKNERAKINPTITSN